MDIIINQVAIWKACGAKKINARKAPIGQKYREPSGVIYKIANSPLIRYAKDYTVKKVKFALFIRTNCENEKLVENYLDYCSKQLTQEYIQNAISGSSIDKFEYTPYIFDENNLITESK